MAQVRVDPTRGGSLTDRDVRVVRLVAKFSQLSSTHIRAIVFPGLSPNTADRSFAKLLVGNYLARVGRRSSATVIGASPIVYRLGIEGRKMFGLGAPPRDVTKLNEHTLTIADTFLLLWNADQQERIVLDADKFEVEYQVAEGIRADIWVKFQVPERGYGLAYYIEVDLGTEPIKRISHIGEASIEEKCQAYRAAYEQSGDEYWPTVAFAVRDQKRKAQIGTFLGGFVADMPQEARALFCVVTFDELVSGLTSVSYPQEQI